MRALHRSVKRRRLTAHGRRASLLHPSCLPNDLPGNNGRNKQTCRDTPTGPARITCIMQINTNMRISCGTRIFTRHVMLRFRPIPTRSTDQRPVTPLAYARGAQTRQKVSARAASGWMGTVGVVARARPSGQALERSPAALADPAPGPGTLRHEIKRRRSWLQASHREKLKVEKQHHRESGLKKPAHIPCKKSGTDGHDRRFQNPLPNNPKWLPSLGR